MKLKLTLITFLIALTPVLSKDSNQKWSNYKGWMNWKEAISLCKKNGMRLPTRKELNNVYKSKLAKSWKKDGSYYWTSEVSLEGGVYVFGINTGNTIIKLEEKGYHTRCIK